MTDELRNSFHDLAIIEAEMRRNIEDYEKLGITPRQFAIKVRTSQYLDITARLKMQHTVNAQVSFSSDRVQTVLFDHKNNIRSELCIIQDSDGKTPGCRNPLYLFARYESEWIHGFVEL